MKKEVKASVGWVAKFSGRDRRFQWVGRDRTGVSRWEGQRDALRIGATVVGVMGLLQVLLGAGTLLFRGHVLTGFIPVCAGASLAATAWWMKDLHAKLKILVTAEEVAVATGVDPESVEQLAMEQELKPLAMLNGEYVYDPQDLLPGARLLRALQGPVDQALLRPAGSVAVAEENLLRPINETDEPVISIQSVQPIDNAESRLQQRT